MHLPKIILILFLIVSSGCAAIASNQPTITPFPSSTSTPSATSTPSPTPTPTQPVPPDGVGDLVVYNYDTGEDETISPTFDVEMDTWVWKNSKGEVRRFLDKETSHVFSQTESVNEKIIYQIDTYFGWEADLTETDAAYDEKYLSAGTSYLSMIDETYPGVLTGFDGNTKVIFKIGQDDFNNIAKKDGISQLIVEKKSAFFWPVHNKNNNTYILAVYIEKDDVIAPRNSYEIGIYTHYLLNYCFTSDLSSAAIIGNVGGLPQKKTIQ